MRKANKAKSVAKSKAKKAVATKGSKATTRAAKSDRPDGRPAYAPIDRKPIKAGSTFTKTLRNGKVVTIKATATDGPYKVTGATKATGMYDSPSAAAKAVAGGNRNGLKFWGIDKARA